MITPEELEQIEKDWGVTPAVETVGEQTVIRELIQEIRALHAEQDRDHLEAAQTLTVALRDIRQAEERADRCEEWGRGHMVVRDALKTRNKALLADNKALLAVIAQAEPAYRGDRLAESDAEIKRLRAVIDALPHESGCLTSDEPVVGIQFCSCPKSRVPSEVTLDDYDPVEDMAAEDRRRERGE